jgi:hypothetical protein
LREAVYAAARSFFSALRITILSASSGNGRCNAFRFIPPRWHSVSACCLIRTLVGYDSHDHEHGYAHVTLDFIR